MLVFGTQIHIVTFIFIILETGMFLFQLFYYLFRPQDQQRKWYLILLFLMLFYNITGGLFPDPHISILVSIQLMVAYGSGFLMASYFPFYFYKAFTLPSLRWHAYYGVPLFLFLPYVIFFIVDFAIQGHLNLKYGMIVPFIYAMVLLYVMFQAIRRKHVQERNEHQYLEEVAMYCAVTPWASLSFFGLIESSQLVEVLCTNTGIIGITILFIWRSIKNARQEYNRLLELARIGEGTMVFEEMCRYYKLTNREIEIVLLVRQGLTYKEISAKLFIAGKTVENHIQHIYEKTQAKNKVTLLHKLFDA
ncbi:helix-turn-helix transcriptional regulator [Mucilaginibacter sp. KACC 22773]|uniref:response regulator transcription factor n=1 Tax=Mucilaginibacter sp. KACC 22773 TaxID=3025671 RepID=UPI0023666169|nr:helix-turn-helix transcriptional regulator [Mucilaginibacter sp. KACC 22773]WDF77067.1 helix-turn-helix transcriptional regulator [Mucilaginibacter sp. KACC 22773]